MFVKTNAYTVSSRHGLLTVAALLAVTDISQVYETTTTAGGRIAPTPALDVRMKDGHNTKVNATMDEFAAAVEKAQSEGVTVLVSPAIIHPSDNAALMHGIMSAPDADEQDHEDEEDGE